MIRGGHEKDIVSLTGVETINDVTGRGLAVVTMPLDRFAKKMAESDQGKKLRWRFKKGTLWYNGVEKGDRKAMEPLREGALGRKPKDCTEFVRDILTTDSTYTLHQNYGKKQILESATIGARRHGRNLKLRWRVVQSSQRPTAFNESSKSESGYQLLA